MEQKKQEKWRQELKVGDRVDAVKGDDKWKCWGVAVISAIRNIPNWLHKINKIIIFK